MKKLIVANWKMNPENTKEVKELFGTVKKALFRLKLRKGKGVKNVKNVEVVICPPFVYLNLLKGLTLGAQNVFYKEKGAFTGEISPLMLKDLRVTYVIVGHCEVRKHFNETDEIINKKIKEVLNAKLKPILCVGETIEEKNAGKNFEVLDKQIKEGLRGISSKEAKNVVIAYEPVWSIGTGQNCSIDQTMSSVIFIRKMIAKLYNKNFTKNIRILYGGSVDSKNSGQYIKGAGVSGLLVGGASLNSEEFIKIVESIE